MAMLRCSRSSTQANGRAEVAGSGTVYGHLGAPPSEAEAVERRHAVLVALPFGADGVSSPVPSVVRH